MNNAHTHKPKSSFVSAVLAVLILSACSGAKFERSTGDDGTGAGGTPGTPPGPVCGPFGGGGGSGKSGLMGSIHYLKDNQPRYNNLYDIVRNGNLITTELFLGSLYVPTRAWESGFKTQDGTLLRKENGEVLVEYFALQLTSLLKLKTGDAEGKYQFAILADDGAVMRINTGGGDTRIIGHEGYTETRLMCANQAVNFTTASKHPVKIDYFQGPRRHIALTLLWRRWPSDNNWQDPLCNQSGNDLFFDSSVDPSRPQQAWNDLMARGWRVVAPANFELPNNITNPCP